MSRLSKHRNNSNRVSQGPGLGGKPAGPPGPTLCFRESGLPAGVVRNLVEIIISDSPLVLSAVYNTDLTSNTFKQLVYERFCSFHNLNYFILRSSRYDPVGRIHNLEESKRIDQEIEEYLARNQINYNRVWLEDTCLEIINPVVKHIYRINTNPCAME